MQGDGAQNIQAGPRPEPVGRSALAIFLRALSWQGQAAVSPKPLPASSDAEAQGLLLEIYHSASSELAGEAPAFRPAVAEWAARLVYQFCQFIVVRELGTEQIAAACRVNCPEARGPGTDWSADLLLRHLPKLFQLARHLSGGDPLLEEMKAVAGNWPLSSVGLPGLTLGSIDSFMSHFALRRLYADRILGAIDLSRLGDARVDELLRADLGLHRELSPVLAGRLFVTPAPWPEGAPPNPSQSSGLINAS